MRRNRKLTGIAVLTWMLAVVFSAHSISQAKQAKHKCAFAPGNPDADYTQILPDMMLPDFLSSACECGAHRRQVYRCTRLCAGSDREL